MATTLLRWLTLPVEWAAARQLVQENFSDVQAALGERVTGRLVTISPYVATGATTTRIFLGRQRAPRAVLLVRAFASKDPGSDLAVSPRLNFQQTTEGLGVYEPSGLVANTSYDLTFLVME